MTLYNLARPCPRLWRPCLFLGLGLVWLAVPAKAETLGDALVATYSTNPTLRAERARLRATDEGVAQAVSAWRPTVVATGSIGERRTKSLTSVNNIGAASVTQRRNLDPRAGEVSIEQPVLDAPSIFNFGAARADVLAGRETLERVEQDIMLRAVTAYVDVLRDEAVVTLNRNNVGVLKQQLDATKSRFDVGEITRTDVAQSEARLSGADTALREAEANLASSRATYEQVVGHMPQGLQSPGSLPPLPESLEAAKEMAVANNPLLGAARANEAASRLRIDAAKGELLPSASLIGSTGYAEDSNVPGDKRRIDEYLAQVTVPIYQGGAEYSNVREARQLNSANRIQIAEAQRAVIAAVTTAWETFQAARTRIVSGEEQVRANSVALEGVRSEADVGARTTLDVLDAEQEYLDAQVALARSRRDEIVAAYSLIAAIGGLNAPQLGLPVEYYDPAENYKRVRLQFLGFGRTED